MQTVLFRYTFESEQKMHPCFWGAQ